MSHRTATVARPAAAVTGAGRADRDRGGGAERGRHRDGALEDRAARRGAEVEHLGRAGARTAPARLRPPRRSAAAARAASPRAEREPPDARLLVRDRGRRRAAACGGARRRRPPAAAAAPVDPHLLRQAVRELPHQLARHVLHHAAPELRRGAADLQLGDDLHARAVAGRLERVLIVADAVPCRARRAPARAAPRGGRPRRPPRSDRAAVAARHRPELDRHRAGELASRRRRRARRPAGTARRAPRRAAPTTPDPPVRAP